MIELPLDPKLQGFLCYWNIKMYACFEMVASLILDYSEHHIEFSVSYSSQALKIISIYRIRTDTLLKFALKITIGCKIVGSYYIVFLNLYSFLK